MGLLGVAGAIALGRFTPQSQLRVNGPRIIEHLNGLAEFGKNDTLSPTSYTPPPLAALPCHRMRPDVIWKSPDIVVCKVGHE